MQFAGDPRCECRNVGKRGDRSLAHDRAGGLPERVPPGETRFAEPLGADADVDTVCFEHVLTGEGLLRGVVADAVGGMIEPDPGCDLAQRARTLAPVMAQFFRTEASRVSRRLLSVRRSYNEQRKEQVFT